MKPTWLTPSMLRNFQQLQGMAIAVVVLALIPWMTQDFAASLAATQMTTHTTLRTVSEKNDNRLVQAFRAARRNSDVEAHLVPEKRPEMETRDALLTITARSKREALDGLAATVAAMQSAFAEAGGDKLYDVGNTPSASPVPNEQTAMVRNICRWDAILILLGGLVLMANRLFHSGLRVASMFAIVGGLVGAALLFFGGPLAWIPGIPVVALVLVAVLTRRVHRAAKWEQGQAHITQSKVTVKRHLRRGNQSNEHCVGGLRFFCRLASIPRQSDQSGVWSGRSGE